MGIITRFLRDMGIYHEKWTMLIQSSFGNISKGRLSKGLEKSLTEAGFDSQPKHAPGHVKSRWMN